LALKLESVFFCVFLDFHHGLVYHVTITVH
jgi:hypothetical protein